MNWVVQLAKFSTVRSFFKLRFTSVIEAVENNVEWSFFKIAGEAEGNIETIGRVRFFFRHNKCGHDVIPSTLDM